MGKRPLNPQVSLFDWLGMVPVIMKAWTNSLYSLFRGLITRNGASTTFRDLAYGLIRSSAGNVSSAQEQYSFVDTTEAYKSWCNTRKIEPASEILPDGTQAHWIGNPKATNVLIYFHGGGFSATARSEYFDVFSDIADTVNAGGGQPKFAALLLAYDVAPYATYPHQLSQAVEIIKHVTEVMAIPTSRIMIAGDSAGANLCLELLGHVLHPHPSPLVPRLELSKSLKGALLICPWVDFRHKSAGFQKNKYKDAIAKKTLDRWAKLYLSGAEADGYNQPLRAPSGWFKSLGNILDEAKILGGGNEILIDDILALAKRLEEEWSKDAVTVEVVPGECHDSFMLDRIFGYHPDGLAMNRAIQEWIQNLSDR